jgi:predicted nucleotidyltransferase
MFTIEERIRIRDRIIQLARSDERVVAGAVVGSLALDDGDRWSDLDLTFGVRDDISIFEVLEDWTENINREFDAVHLFD